MGFQGFIMTDWLGHYGGVASTLAGLDMSMPGDGSVPLFGDSHWAYRMSTSVLNGTVPLERLNDMVCQFSPLYPLWKIHFAVTLCSKGV